MPHTCERCNTPYWWTPFYYNSNLLTIEGKPVFTCMVTRATVSEVQKPIELCGKGCFIAQINDDADPVFQIEPVEKKPEKPVTLKPHRFKDIATLVDDLGEIQDRVNQLIEHFRQPDMADGVLGYPFVTEHLDNIGLVIEQAIEQVKANEV